MKSLRWLSRVPATIKQTQELLTLDSEMFQNSEIQGYRFAEIVVTMARLNNVG